MRKQAAIDAAGARTPPAGNRKGRYPGGLGRRETGGRGELVDETVSCINYYNRVHEATRT